MPTNSRIVLSARDLVIEFAGVQALRGVTLDVREGEVLAVVGENGAGKSTLMRILAGVYPHGDYQGELFPDGSTPGAFSSVRVAEDAGIVLIPQELQVVPELTVAENLYLGCLPTRRFGLVDERALMLNARGILTDFGVHVEPATPMGELRAAQQQLIEIVRALRRSARVLILDEPTAALSRGEADLLFERVDQLRARGVSSIFVSHRIDEVKRIADRVAVLRDGVLVGVAAAAALSHDDIVEMMLGREISRVYPVRSAAVNGVALDVRDLVVYAPGLGEREVVAGISFECRAGEIVGLFGLVGAGRTEAALALFGAWPGRVQGSASVGQRKLTFSDPAASIAAGLALVTEDRKTSGLVLDMGIPENVSLASLRRLAHGPVLDQRAEHVQAAEYVDGLGIKAPGLAAPVRTLSGGNQQKVVLAKWLATEPKVLLLDEPTRGVDIGAKIEIYRELGGLAARGVAIVFISSELPEVLGVCDRVLVMYQGRIVGEFASSSVSEQAVLRLATGGA